MYPEWVVWDYDSNRLVGNDTSKAKCLILPLYITQRNRVNKYRKGTMKAPFCPPVKFIALALVFLYMACKLQREWKEGNRLAANYATYHTNWFNNVLREALSRHTYRFTLPNRHYIGEVQSDRAPLRQFTGDSSLLCTAYFHMLRYFTSFLMGNEGATAPTRLETHQGVQLDCESCSISLC